MNFLQRQELNPQGQKQNTENTYEEQLIPQAQTLLPQEHELIFQGLE